MTASLSLADQGYTVHLIEKEEQLGGLLRRVRRNLEGDDVQQFLAQIIDNVTGHPNIQVHLGTTVADTDGFVGNFHSKLTNDQVVEHGAILIASGAVEYTPTEYNYDSSDRIITQRQLEDILAERTIESDETIVMIQCVGSSKEPTNYCSRTFCQDALKNAILRKSLQDRR